MKERLKYITGLQKKIYILLYTAVTSSSYNITGPIIIKHLSAIIGGTDKDIKTSIKRLEQKGLIRTIEYKSGCGGWSRYALTDNPYFLDYEI